MTYCDCCGMPGAECCGIDGSVDGFREGYFQAIWGAVYGSDPLRKRDALEMANQAADRYRATTYGQADRA